MDLMRIDPVYVYEATPEANEDVRFAGSLFLKQKSDGQFLEWKINDTSIINSSPKNNLRHHKHMLDFNIEDLKSVREAGSDSPGSRQLTFILKCGSTLQSLHLPIMECENLIHKLKQYIPLHRSSQDEGLYIVRLKKTFDEFNLFGAEPGVEAISKFLNDPFAGLTKVTKYLHEFGKELSSSREGLATPSSTQATSVAGDYKEIEALTLNYDNGSEFEFITPAMKGGDLPARPQVERGSPITAREWSSCMDEHGRITNPSATKQLIFRRGIDSSIRQEVWKFLLGYYPWDSTSKSRVEQRKVKIDNYFRMKLQWKSIDDDQLGRFNSLRDRKSLAEKDVWRTDRNHKFFEGRNNPNLSMLHDILLTHCMYDFDLGYVQGMSDLLAPILVIMEHEVDAFWSFAGFTKLLSHNFEKDQQSMKNQLSQLQFLIKYLDPDFSSYLDKHDSLNMYFCFRWLLIIFKREFSFPDIMRLWEVLWTGLPCQNFHLLVCLAILETFRSTLVENDFGFTEILKLVNDMSGRIDVEEVLRIAEGMYLQVTSCPTLPPTIKKILGLHEYHDDSSTSPFQPFNPFDEHSSPKIGGFNSGGTKNSNSRVQSPTYNNISPVSQSSDKLVVSDDYSQSSFASNPSKESSSKENDSIDYSNIEVLDAFNSGLNMI